MKAEQKKDFKDNSVVHINPLPLVFGRADDTHLPKDKEGCLFLVLIMLVVLVMLTLCIYVAVSR